MLLHESDVERLDSADAVSARIDRMVARAHTEIALCVSVRPLVDERTLPRGTPVRVLYPDGQEMPSFLFGHDQVRVSADVPTGLVVCDRAEAVVPVDATDPSRGALVVTARGMVAALAALFDHLWSDAMAVCPRPRDGLTEQERQVLGLLARGVTDDAVAARLGTSARSVRRIMAGLMGRLGARSRFEAGHLAVRRGWL